MEALQAIDRHLDAAKLAAEGEGYEGLSGPFRRFRAGVGGASVERANGHIDAAEIELLRLAPEPYLRGQLPNLVGHVTAHLPKDDPRRRRIKEIAEEARTRVTTDDEREVVAAAVRRTSLESRREVTRVRSFRNLLVVCSVVLTVAVASLVILAASSPSTVPLCFHPEGTVVCPTHTVAVGAAGGPSAAAAQDPQTQQAVDEATRRTAAGWDVPLVALLGVIAAALAAATALRRIQGTSTPYSLPVAVALLKLPSGALTAILGLLLMRGEFVPGLSALDSSAQIVAWAIIFGYSQQIFTRYVDDRAKTVLDGVKNSRVPASNGTA